MSRRHTFEPRRRPVQGGTAMLALSLVALVIAALGGCKREGFCVDCGDGTGGDGAPRQTPSLGFDAGVGGNPDGSTPIALIDAATPPLACTPRFEGERCNGLDDDCDDVVDEGFDLDADPMHCGACNTPCQVENGEASCQAGVCEFGGCLPGFADLDGAAPDCEYRCPVFPGRAEHCNGLDDDCDGVVDETLGPPPEGLCRTTPGTPCALTTASCRSVGGVTDWYCDYDAKVEFDPVVPNGIVLEEASCDGFDGDCDGEVDEPWPIGQACDDGGVGICRDVGAMACDPDDDSAAICDLSVPPDAEPATAERCNGRDDDCDGMVDNGVVDDMVHVTEGGADFYIFRYEASRPDASETEQGLSDARACSKPDALPWTFVTYAQAQAACQASGKRMCTGAEWSAACSAGDSYPYGDAYEFDTCNGADTETGLQATASFGDCRSHGGAFDLSGNVKEWTNETPAGTQDIQVVRGGSHESPALGLTCQTRLSQAAAGAGQAAIGFRCCSDGAP